jgi:DNA primase
MFTKTEISQGKVSERIKAASPLHQFISQYVKLDAHGKGHCPFHNDTHASFQLDEQRGIWNCYAGDGDDIIHF